MTFIIRLLSISPCHKCCPTTTSPGGGGGGSTAGTLDPPPQLLPPPPPPELPLAPPALPPPPPALFLPGLHGHCHPGLAQPSMGGRPGRRTSPQETRAWARTNINNYYIQLLLKLFVIALRDKGDCQNSICSSYISLTTILL